MKLPTWIGSRPTLVCQQFKKHLVLQPWQTAMHIQFRFEAVWCIREGNSLLLADGSLFPFTKVYADGKCLVGKDDAYQTGLDYNPDSRAFRAALDQRALEQGKKDLAKLMEENP